MFDVVRQADEISISCSRDWGMPQSLVVTRLTSPLLTGAIKLRISGGGIRIETVTRSAGELVIAIEIASDAAPGRRDLIVEKGAQTFIFPRFFTIAGRSSYAGPGSRGIGTHLL
jgi:hypothetical protein